MVVYFSYLIHCVSCICRLCICFLMCRRLPVYTRTDTPCPYTTLSRSGGPVEPSRGFVLHSRGGGGQEAVQVGDRWMISSSHDILRAIGEGRGPSDRKSTRLNSSH